jgi:hypothetical protein
VLGVPLFLTAVRADIAVWLALADRGTTAPATSGGELVRRERSDATHLRYPKAILRSEAPRTGADSGYLLRWLAVVQSAFPRRSSAPRLCSGHCSCAINCTPASPSPPPRRVSALGPPLSEAREWMLAEVPSTRARRSKCPSASPTMYPDTY